MDVQQNNEVNPQGQQPVSLLPADPKPKQTKKWILIATLTVIALLVVTYVALTPYRNARNKTHQALLTQYNKSDIQNWEVVDKLGFSIKMPDAPVEKVQSVTSAGTPLTITSYTARLEQSTYVVTTTTFPDSVNLSNPTVNLNSAADSALANLSKPIVRSRNLITTMGSPSIQVEAGGVNNYLLFKAVIKGHTIYSIVAGSDTTAPAIQGNAFLDSFKLK